MSEVGRQVNFPPFPPEYRASGVLLHVASLPSPYGIGDVGPAALAWIDRLHEAGQGWWQALPLGPTGYGNSPYQLLSSFAGNELLISPAGLIEDGLVRADDCEGNSFSGTSVDYDRVIPFKNWLLATAWANLSTGARPDLRPGYDQFCHDQAHWLEDYALFRALKTKYRGAHYRDWAAELVARAPSALALARRELADQIEQVRLAQFLFSRQGERLKAHARRKCVRLIGDLPFFVSPDSSDVWANPELFLLDERRKPRFVAGAPPDYFSAQGQLWGNPVYALRDRFQLPGMRVLQFAFDGKSDNPHLPHNYVPNTVVYTGAHDNPTTRGWFDALPDQQRQCLWHYLQRPAGENCEAAPALIKLAWSSVAALAIAPLQDLLNLGNEARMNLPGRAEGNWRWRYTEDMLTPEVFRRLYDLTETSARTFSESRRLPER